MRSTTHRFARHASLVAVLIAGPAWAADPKPLDALPKVDALGYVKSAANANRLGSARKTKPVDARPAVAGEVVVSIIAGEGVETRSKPAKEGDWVVRNRCPETGNEEILVSAAKFPTRYGEPIGQPDAKGYREFHPKGTAMDYVITRDTDGEFAIQAPWGELQRVRPGDAIVQIPEDRQDTYRIQGQSFACTYEVLTPPPAK
jgi:hypothetical protein